MIPTRALVDSVIGGSSPHYLFINVWFPNFWIRLAIFSIGTHPHASHELTTDIHEKSLLVADPPLTRVFFIDLYQLITMAGNH